MWGGWVLQKEQYAQNGKVLKELWTSGCLENNGMHSRHMGKEGWKATEPRIERP